jgi:hydroxyacylglutathione hydrolase
MLIKTLNVGHLDTNCYVVTDEDSLLCAVIDPGAESNTILDYLEEHKLKCAAILLTHAHFDHVGAVDTVLEETGAQLYLCGKELQLSPRMSGGWRPGEGARFYAEGDTVAVGALCFTVLETPGHTPGGVCLLCGSALFTGDTLFRGSCGRADFEGADLMQEFASLKKLAELPGDYEVYPGHDIQTTLSREREANPYMKRAMEL